MKFVQAIILSLILSACSTQYHKEQVEDKNSKLTLGNVQKNIKVGMSGADVARVMGSPNVVTKDGDNAEVWIYDKISTETANSNSSLLGVGGVLGGSAGVGGLGTYSGSASSQNQKTLTVVIKFDNNIVTKVDYNASSF
jgi:outer membrane protein assembly factor BamE (lipoprotein component of BamABCDE complex)